MNFTPHPAAIDVTIGGNAWRIENRGRAGCARVLRVCGLNRAAAKLLGSILADRKRPEGQRRWRFKITRTARETAHEARSKALRDPNHEQTDVALSDALRRSQGMVRGGQRPRRRRWPSD